MSRVPIRKCLLLLRAAIIVCLAGGAILIVDRWRGGNKLAEGMGSDELERLVREDEAKQRPHLGEGGAAAQLTGDEAKKGEESERKLAMNVYLSDRIPYNRTLKDYRNPACARVLYDAELPSASVVIIFHNEPYSAVVRTLWSVLNSARRDRVWHTRLNLRDRSSGKTMTIGYPGQAPTSTYVYLKEIILVDDNSTLPELKDKLSHYVRTRMPADMIRILRLPDRVGLTRARLAGARYAAGDVLVFLDAHCETVSDWLRPLLQRIKDAPHAVVAPVIDAIDASTFFYSTMDDKNFQVGGFTFMGHFTWIDVPEWEKKRRGSDISPTWSPTMAGGLFAMSRSYFWQLGGYDEQMAGWGGENLEISFRIWQCGGTLETVPCSRVGHVFRRFHPYGLPYSTDTHGINTARMAEVWMDDYKELFYLHRPDLRNNPKIGDVTHRRVLREKLQCKSFEWYLEHIYREKFVPVRDVYGYGRFRNVAAGLCLDTMQREQDGSALGVYTCHDDLHATQYLALSISGELRDEEKCAEVHERRANDAAARKVVMVNCHGKQRSQKWRRLNTGGQLEHVESHLCLTATGSSGDDVVASTCDNNNPAQKWHIDYSEENDFVLHSDRPPTEQEIKLRSLRGQKRISRSLLSLSREEADTNKKQQMVRRKKHGRHGKKQRRTKKVKNKFILQIVRSLPNNTEEHLEVDIHCRHKKLLPNNTFVRDLVTILNNNDIKIINNGRIFEKNRVTDISNGKPVEKVLEKLPIATDRKVQLEPAEPALRSPVSVHPKAENKRIIIEDFVEIKSSTEAPKSQVAKRKRKHRKRKPAPVQKVQHEAVTDSGVVARDPRHEQAPLPLERNKLPAADEDDDATMLLEVPPQSLNSDEDAGPNMRKNMDYEESSADNDLETESPPVKLVLKSNLTFNLADDFFNWKRNEQQSREETAPASVTRASPTVVKQQLNDDDDDERYSYEEDDSASS